MSMQPSSPLRLDLVGAQCSSLEMHFFISLPEPVRQELAALGAREAEDVEDRIFFHEDYRHETQKVHSWGEVQIVTDGESEVAVEYLVESELDDQTELHQTDFTLSHLFGALESMDGRIEAAFTLRFDLGPASSGRLLRLFPYSASINSGLSVEYRGAHVAIKSPEGDAFDVWYDLRPDDSMEATVRFALTERPTAELPGRGLEWGRKALGRVLGP